MEENEKQKIKISDAVFSKMSNYRQVPCVIGMRNPSPDAHFPA